MAYKELEVTGHYPAGWQNQIQIEPFNDETLEVGEEITIYNDKYYVIEVIGFMYLLNKPLVERLVNQDVVRSHGKIRSLESSPSVDEHPGTILFRKPNG